MHGGKLESKKPYKRSIFRIEKSHIGIEFQNRKIPYMYARAPGQAGLGVRARVRVCLA